MPFQILPDKPEFVHQEEKWERHKKSNKKLMIF
jgi:hypothetical protein